MPTVLVLVLLTVIELCTKGTLAFPISTVCMQNVVTQD